MVRQFVELHNGRIKRVNGRRGQDHDSIETLKPFWRRHDRRRLSRETAAICEDYLDGGSDHDDDFAFEDFGPFSGGRSLLDFDEFDVLGRSDMTVLLEVLDDAVVIERDLNPGATHGHIRYASTG